MSIVVQNIQKFKNNLANISMNLLVFVINETNAYFSFLSA